MGFTVVFAGFRIPDSEKEKKFRGDVFGHIAEGHLPVCP